VARYVDAYKIEYEDITDENGDTYMVAHAPQIESLETEDVQPVVHSKWEISSDGYYPYCKRCKARPLEMTKYCPECGARMDGD